MRKLKPITAKRRLISFHGFKNSDFYEEGNEVYMNCKDNVMIKATDLIEDLTKEYDF